MRMRHAAVVAGLALGLMSGAAKAAYIVNIDQVGANVVATGSGSIDLSGARFNDNGGGLGVIAPSQSLIYLGNLNDGDDRYTASIFASSAFGSGGATYADALAGPIVGIDAADGFIEVPTGYISNAPLGLSTLTFYNSNFSTLGLTNGSFQYSILTQNEIPDTFTINVNGMSPVPLPASAPMFGAALLALGAIGYGVQRKKAAAAA